SSRSSRNWPTPWLLQRAAKLSVSNTHTSIGAIVRAAQSCHARTASGRARPAEVQLASSEVGAGCMRTGYAVSSADDSNTFSEGELENLYRSLFLSAGSPAQPKSVPLSPVAAAGSAASLP